jgi:predicted acylesterase/phospholipase RssA
MFRHPKFVRASSRGYRFARASSQTQARNTAMTPTRFLSLAPILAAIAVLTGCTFVNVPLNPLDAPVTSRKTNHTRASLLRSSEITPDTAPPLADDGWFVGLAISGGGSRSANFSAAVMFQLQRLGLLDRVDAISSVSGGSLTAAYYCLSTDQEWNPANLQRLLTHSFAADAWSVLLQPWNLIALAISDWDRSDILADSFTKTLYTRAGKTLTFADLRQKRPRLLVNATDLQSGQRFVFANESFDTINSDLSKYPIGYAVAASSSVPIVLHQVTLRDFSTVFAQYRHFVDGGINDNLGVLSLLEAYKADNDAATSKGQPPPFSKGAVLIIIDAGTQFNAKLSDKGDVGLLESLGTGAKLSTAKLLNRASTATLADLIVQYAPKDMTAEDIRKHLSELQDIGFLQAKDRDGRPLTIIHIALSRAASLKNAPYHNFGSALDEIDTYFNMSEADAYSLYQAADLIVKEKFEQKLIEIREMLQK